VKPAAPSSNWKLITAAVLVTVVLLGYGVSYWLRPVAEVQAAVRGKAVQSVQGTVTVFAEYQMELKSAVGGRVLTSVLDVGKKVGRGDVLLQLDTGDLDLEIERIRNEITAAKRKVELGSTLRPEVLNARDTLDNLERQTKAGAYPAAEFEKQKRLFQQLQQRMELEEVSNQLALDNFENSLRSKEREKGKMTITNPLDGVVTAVLAREGDLISANFPIATIMTTTRTVECKLSEENFANIKLGQNATVRFLSFGQEQYNGKVSKILPSADSATQRYTVFLDMFIPEGKVLVPGLTGEASIIISEHPNAVIIPRRALVGDYVYVVEGSSLALRKVQKGYEGLKEVEITGGVQEGERVVVEQQDRFRDGDRVRVQPASN
jgi:RND family efflux transporter MFP subunit